MRKTLLLLGFVLCALISNAQYKAYTIQATVSLTTDSLLIVNGDTIGHFHSLGTDTIVDKSYIDALFTGTYVEFGDSVITFVTPAQLSDSLSSLPGGHDAVTLAASATNGGLSLVGQQIGFQAASTSLAGYLTSGNFNLFNNKLSYVSHDETLSGNGTTGSPLSADTSVVALRTWVESQNYVTSVYLSYDSLSDTPTIPEISNIAYGASWDDNLDGASKNAIYDAIQSIGGGGATNLTYSATPDSGVVISDTGTDATIPAGSTVNASLMLPEDKEYLDVVDDSLANHRTAINTSISDISALSDSVDVFRPLIDANTGKDTTGIYHTNRALLDAISASDLDSNFVSLHTDTLFLGADTLVEVTDIGDLVFSILKTDTLVIGGDTIINFDLDTTNISGLQTFVENHSIGSFTETDPIYSADPASGITSGNINDWNTAYSWGNHIGEYIPIDHTVYNILNGTGFLKNDGLGGWSYDNNTYLTDAPLDGNTYGRKDGSWSIVSSSLWTEDSPNGIYYNSGNVVIGDNTALSGFKLSVLSTGNPLYLQGISTSKFIRTFADGSGLKHEFYGSGAVRFYDYGDGTFTGTATKLLAVDSNGNIIEEDIPSISETDPIFSTHAASGITSTDLSNWNTAYGWGDHSTEGYLTAIPGIDDVLGVGNYTTKKLALGSSVAPSSVFEAKSASDIFIAKLIGQSSLTEGLHIQTAGTTGTSLLKMDNSSSTNIYNFLSSGLFTFKSLTGHPTSTPPGGGYGGLYMYDNTLWFYNGSNSTVYDLLDISGSGASTFIDLTDTPSSYTGQAGKWLKVNSGATGLEFTDAPGSGSSLWTSGTYGINYNGNVGIGTSADQYVPLTVTSTNSGYMLEVLNSQEQGSGVYIEAGQYNTFNSSLLIKNNTPTTLFDVRSSGAIYMPSISSATTSNVLYFNSSTGLVTYGAASSSGSTTFLGLTDTPSSYTAGKWLKVNSGGTALEFVNSPITSVTGVGSVLTSGTTSTAVVSLVNDLTTPGNSKYYGTDGSGTRGWYSLPSGTSSIWGSSTYGIYYNSGNVGVGVTALSSVKFTSAADIASGWAANLYNTSLTGNGVRISTNNNSSSLEALSVASSLGDIFSIYNNGQIQLHNYGTGAITGTVAKILGVDSNGKVIETTASGSGSVTSVGLTSTDLTITGSPITTSGTITANIAASGVQATHLNNNIISGKTALTSGLVSTDELLISDAGTVKRMDVSVLETYMQDNLSFSGVDVTVQDLTGTSPRSWDMSNGINAKITLSADVTINLSNVPVGYSGNLTVTNAETAYTIQFAGTGYTFKFSPYLDSSSGVITMTGGSKVDELSWYYDGTYVIINGQFSYD